MTPVRLLIAAFTIMALQVAEQGFANTLTTRQAHSQGTFVSDLDGLIPGETISVGVRIELEPDWHTYWINPGDSASTAIFDFQLPDGYEVSTLKYPVPHRIPVGPLMSIGYDNETLLFVDIKVPLAEQAHIGEQRSLRLSAEWLVCKEECIPAFFDFALTLPLKKSAEATSSAALFQKARSTIDTTVADATYRRDGETIMVDIPARGDGWLLEDVFAFPNMPLTNAPVGLGQVDAKLFQARLSYRKLDQDPQTLQLLTRWRNGASQQIVGQTIKAAPAAPSLAPMLGFAFLGGLILNLMPCVFPVLALKLFSLVKVSEQSRATAFLSQAVYQLGVLVSFWLLAAVLIVARSGGSSLGWGFQLQEPLFVVFLVLLFFVMALNFLGVIQFHFQHAGIGQGLTQKDGWIGSFFTGVLAVIVASPCTAPFMGAAMGYALSQSAWEVFLVFSALGLGLGSPYLFFGVFPGLAKFLPRPGHWMNHLREFMAFPLFATAVWLLFVLGQQVGSLAMSGALLGLVFVGLGVWSIQRFSGPIRLLWLAIAAAGLIGSLYFVKGSPLQTTAVAETSDEWQVFSRQQLASLREENVPVFINFTAAWCISCQVNDQTTFRNADVKDYVRDNGIAMLKADWTNRDEVIGGVLREYGRVGVPLYLYFSPGAAEAIVLPEVLTPAIFKSYVSVK